MTLAGKPLVSVIVRTLATPDLADALDSVAAQTWRPLECIVVDAAGTADAGIGRALDRLGGDVGTQVVCRARRLPRPVAANAGLAAARGEWIAFLDEDDTWLPEHLSGLLTAADPAQARLVYCNARMVAPGRPVDGVVGGPPDPLRMFFSAPFAIHAALIHRSLLAAGLAFDERLDVREDQDFWLQARELTDFRFVPQTTAVYRVTAGNSGSYGRQIGAGKAVTDAERYLNAKWAARRNACLDEVRGRLDTAQRALMARDYATAQTLLLDVLRDFPKEVNAYNLLGMLHLECGEAASALDLLRQAAALAPGHHGVLLNLGLAFEGNGLVADARSCFERVLLLKPDAEAARRKLAALAGR